MKKSWQIGIDEAGRGPLAGPIAVGIARVPADFNWGLLPGVTDSKKLSPHKRQVIFKLAKQLRRQGKLDYTVVLKSAKLIDDKGLTVVVNAAIATGLSKIEAAPHQSIVLLDGGLRAPGEFTTQKTIIKGDQKEKVIGLASIVAKETRDDYMRRSARRLANYDFEVHMGYGTKRHRELIVKHGLSPLHRRTFCRNLVLK